MIKPELKVLSPSESSEIICHFCGFSFSSDTCATTCANCPSMFSCNLFRCPNCGYSFPSQESSFGRLIRRVYSKLRKK